MSLEELVRECPFDYRATKSGLLIISNNGRAVATLSGRECTRLLSKLESATKEQAQLAMAKATGHFKHGNERAAKK